MSQVVEHRRPGPLRVTVTAATALVAAVLPMFLIGALGPRIIADLGVDEVAIGAVVAVFFLASALLSLPGGALTDRVGSTAALRIGALIAATLSVIIALLGQALWILLVLFALAGAAVPMADTGGARAIAAGVPVDRQGIAFGGKEASIPVAALLAGLVVPVLGAQVGWRPAYAVAAGLAVVVAVLVPRGLDTARRADVTVAAAGSTLPGHDPARTRCDDHPPVTSRRAALVLLAVAAGLGGGAANSAPTFLVTSAVVGGMTEARAGLLLAVASGAGVLMRLLSGVAADRSHGSERRLTAVLMGIGALGMVGLAVGSPVIAGVGAILAFGGGWGWTGLAFLAAVRLLADRPARAAGAILAGLGSGGALGPLAFGALAAGPGYAVAWSAGAGALLTAAVLAGTAEVVIRRGRGDPP